MNSAPFLLVDAGNSRIKWALVQTDGTRTHVGAFAHAHADGGAKPDADARAHTEGTDEHVKAHASANGHVSPFAHTRAGVHGDALFPDTGNTHADALTRAALLFTDAITTGPQARPLETDAPLARAPDWCALPRPRGAWISNVAGQAVARRIDALIDAHWPALPRTTVCARARQCGVSNGYAAPDTLGSDRWASLIGARAAFPGEPLLIATFGTATTLEALRADGAFVGGLITPGWALMMRALGENTAQLPVLDAFDAPAARGLAPPHALPLFATDTPGSISTGCALAQAGLVERIWTDLRQAWAMPVRLVVSGGGAAHVRAVLKAPHTYHESLVLAGLAVIAAWPRQFGQRRAHGLDPQSAHWPVQRPAHWPDGHDWSDWPDHRPSPL